MMNVLKNLWFEDAKAPVLYINDTAMRIRAGMLLLIPLFISFTLYDAVFMGNYAVNTDTLVDTYDTNWDDQIIYTAEVSKRVNEYSTQTFLLLFAFFEMIAGMFVITSRFSPLILISSFLSRNTRAVWKPLNPKRFAWSLGASMIFVCLVFFNPDSFAGFLNGLFNKELLPTNYNYIPYEVPVSLFVLCASFMWLEVVFGFCVGCKIHAFLVLIKVIDDECEACNDITLRK